MRSLVLLLLIGSTLAAQSPSSDDKFDSENKAQTTRPKSVLKDAQRPDLPYKMSPDDLKGQTVTPAAEVKTLTGRDGKDALVDGTVASTFVPKGGKMLLLNLGKDYKNCFKVLIDDGDFAKWGTKKPEEIAKMYEGKRVVVGGWVSLYQDLPQIRVTLPSQLSVVEDAKK
jgi:hypothetical protein